MTNGGREVPFNGGRKTGRTTRVGSASLNSFCFIGDDLYIVDSKAVNGVTLRMIANRHGAASGYLVADDDEPVELVNMADAVKAMR